MRLWALAAALLLAAPAWAGPAKPKKTPPPPPPRALLVVSTLDTAGVAVPEVTKKRFGDRWLEAVKKWSGDRYAFELPPKSKKKLPGYRVRGTIAVYDVEAIGEEKKLSVEIRATVTTWPGDHLRFVITAKANAKAALPPEQLDVVVLEAAISDAARDVIAGLDKKK